MTKIKFFRPGKIDSVVKLSDVFCEFIYADRFYCSIDNLFLHHNNNFTSVIEIDADLFKQLYTYDKSKGRYVVNTSIPFKSQLARFSITILEH